MVGPATRTELEVGLNLKDVAPTPRLIALKQLAMCQVKLRLSDKSEIDAELLGWIKQAYQQAG